ncbi:MAG: hypothetical protein ACSW8A_00005, partial [Lachnospiraceae bacterium]
MAGKYDIYHSILIVSQSEQFNSVVKQSFVRVASIECRKSAATARRSILERYYDIIVINGPLQDETGESLALDAAEKSNALV